MADKKDRESLRAEESGNYMDKLQDAGVIGEQHPTPEVSNEPQNTELKEEKKDEGVKFDRSSVELDIPLEELHPVPEEVEDPYVVFVPQKDFGARINKDTMEFRKGVRVRVTRDMANMLMEDDSRGYIQD